MRDHVFHVLDTALSFGIDMSKWSVDEIAYDLTSNDIEISRMSYREVAALAHEWQLLRIAGGNRPNASRSRPRLTGSDYGSPELSQTARADRHP